MNKIQFKYIDDILGILESIPKKKEQIRKNIYNRANSGQKRKEIVFLSLLSATFFALKELKNNFKIGNNLSTLLLIRYIYENMLSFQYIFLLQKSKIQNKVDAFYYFTLAERNKVIKIKHNNEINKWKKAIVYSKRSRKTWSGESLADMAGIVRNYLKEKKEGKDNFHFVIYKGLSLFSHPSLLSMEFLFENNLDIGNFNQFNIKYSCADIICSINSAILNKSIRNFVFTKEELLKIKKINIEVERNLRKEVEKINQKA